MFEGRPAAESETYVALVNDEILSGATAREILCRLWPGFEYDDWGTAREALVRETIRFFSDSSYADEGTGESLVKPVLVVADSPASVYVSDGADCGASLCLYWADDDVFVAGLAQLSYQGLSILSTAGLHISPARWADVQRPEPDYF